MMSWTAILLLCSWLICVVVFGQNPIGLRASSSIRGLPFGTAASIENLRNNADGGQFNPYIMKNYQLIEPENDLKPQKLWRGENNYDWTDSDWLLGATPDSTGWAQQNGMQIRGHTLVWATDATTPGWLLQQESSISSDKARSLMSDYIHAVVGRYRGKIPWWDVVNEAIDDSENNGRPFNIRNCFWYRKLGQDFVKYAFIFAHQADSQAQLYYNDYNTEGMGSKANNALALITWAKSQGATIHGVGMQWHIGLWASPQPGDQYYQNAQRLIENGFDIMVTELDVALPMNGDHPQDPADLQRQALVYRALVKYALHFSPRCRALITWGFTDRYSWIPYFSNYREGAALPSDWNYQPKPAYWHMQEELTRVLPDGTYRLTPDSHSNMCLDTYDLGETGGVQVYNTWNGDNQKWDLTWLGDGTYRLSPQSSKGRALNAYDENASHGGVQVYNWWNGDSQKWILSPVGGNKFRVGPRNVWWRALTADWTSNIVIRDYTSTSDQHWTFINV
jgi:endo-1,4-beta-xylanase